MRNQNFIDNNWIDGTGDETLRVLNKYTQREIAAIQLAGEDQMEQAIAAANKAFDTYRSWSAEKRSKCLEKLANLLEEQQAAFVDLIVQEAGKPRGYAVGELSRALTTIRTAASESLRFSGEVVALDFDKGEGKRAFTHRYPIGVIGCITPFNFPLNLVLHKVAPALASGNTVVLKPAMQTPLTALALADLVEKAGFPKGVFNVVVCGNDVAERLVRHEDVAMLSFTGSDKVGWKLKEICGKKRIALELGGNAAVYVDASADLEGVAEQLAIGSFLYAGQICIAVQRIYAHGDVFEQLKEELVEATKALKIGDPNDENTTVGPIISHAHLDRIDQWVREATDRGAAVLYGGKIEHEGHNLFQPTLLTNTDPEMKVWKEEVFGPVSILEKVEDFEAGMQAINRARYGLQAGLFTNRLDQFRRSQDMLEVGGIIMNGIPGFRVDSMPYGGIKDSGLGREGIKYAMEEMTELRLMVY